jgi:DNA primase
VATAGTALTEMQLKVLGRLTPDIRLAFDEDRAGIAATERAIPIASKVHVELSVITIPSGKDPDELIQQDPQLWIEAIANKTYALDWLIGVYKNRLDLTSATGKRQFSDIVLNVIRGLSDQVEQDHYIQIVARELDVSPDAIRAKMQGEQEVSRQPLRRTKATNIDKSIDPVALKTGDHLLSLALMLPGTRGYLDLLEPYMFVRPQAQKLFVFLKEHPEFDGKLSEADVLHEIEDYVKIVSVQFEELYGTVDTLELQYEAARLRAKIIDLYVKTQKKLLSSQFAEASSQEANVLLKKVRELDQLLNRIKE